MPIVVQKYGGSSVDCCDKVLEVAARVAALRRDGNDVVVVVSAQGGTTDSLLREARCITPEPTQRELDMLVTAGERISMSLLAIALNSLGCRAMSFTGSQVGIITDTRHTDARILEVRPHRLVRELERGSVVVVGGFQGVSTDKEITTLGRGGSDTTAVALAAALGAERCEILTDVDGVLTADPRIVDNVALIDEISYEDMAELARFGATVLKEEAVRFAEREGIALSVGSSTGPSGGTIVIEKPASHERPVVGLSLLPDASLLELGTTGSGVANETLASLGPAVRFVVGGAGVMVVGLEGDGPAGAEPVSLVCAAGPEAGSGETLSTFLETASRSGCPVSAFSSGGRVAVAAVPRDSGETLLKALHARLIEGGGV